MKFVCVFCELCHWIDRSIVLFVYVLCTVAKLFLTKYTDTKCTHKTNEWKTEIGAQNSVFAINLCRRTKNRERKRLIVRNCINQYDCYKTNVGLKKTQKKHQIATATIKKSLTFQLHSIERTDFHESEAYFESFWIEWYDTNFEIQDSSCELFVTELTLNAIQLRSWYVYIWVPMNADDKPNYLSIHWYRKSFNRSLKG